MNARELSHADDWARDVEIGERLLSGAIPGYEMEKRYVRPDGEVVRGFVRVALVRTEDGAPLHLVVLILDVTERRRDEELLQSIFTESPDLICIADFGGRFLRVSP